MVKRTAKGRQVPHSKKNATKGSSNRTDDIDWNISSEEASGDEMLNLDSVSDHSDMEEKEEENETVEEKKLRLAKEYLEKVRLEEEDKGISEESSEDEGVEERIEKRLQREAEEVFTILFYNNRHADVYLSRLLLN